MSEGLKHPYDQVLPVARHIVQVLASYCERIEIAGSLRRRRPMIGDIEIVAQVRRPINLFGEPDFDGDTALDVFLATKLSGNFIKNGPKHKSFLYGRYKVDLFLPLTAAHWGSILTIRTGSHDFNMWVMGTRSKQVGIRFTDGLVYDWQGNLIPVPEEIDVFNALEMPFIPPEMRDGGRWLEYVKEHEK